MSRAQRVGSGQVRYRLGERLADRYLEFVAAVARVAGVSETTVLMGVFELEAGEAPFREGQVRRGGGGRTRAADRDRDLVPALVEPDERGDPESPLRWTTKSLRHLAGELGRQGHRVSAPTVGRLPPGPKLVDLIDTRT